MNISALRQGTPAYPERLNNIARPPKILYHIGTDLSKLLDRPCLAIVGSRSVSTYGRRVTEKFASELAEQGFVIISGLALGVDTIAHRAALDAGGQCIAVLPTPVDCPYPAANLRLARRILESGGALVSEYADTNYERAFKSNFVARNRIVAGLSQAVLIPEAAEKSGSLHTARFAMDQGKDVLSVPGDIFSLVSVGTNNILRTGATPTAKISHVLQAFGIEERPINKRIVRGRNDNEQMVLDLMMEGVSDGVELMERSGLEISAFNQVITMLEIGGKIRAMGANQWSL